MKKLSVFILCLFCIVCNKKIVANFRDADMEHMDQCATCFLLSPGAVQIFYGDEVARKTTDAILNVDAAQAFRSDYDWSKPNDTLMAHYQKLCAFRKHHPAVGTGTQTIINSKTVARSLGDDHVVIVLQPEKCQLVDVSLVFADGQTLKDAYSGATMVVEKGHVQLHPIATPLNRMRLDIFLPNYLRMSNKNCTFSVKTGEQPHIFPINYGF